MRRTTKDQYTRQSAIIQQLLHETAAEQGAMNGFVQRWLKMTAEVFVQILVLGQLESGEATLNDAVPRKTPARKSARPASTICACSIGDFG